MITQSKQNKQNVSLENYRQLEEISEFKHEYHNGVIIPMTGGTINHNRIIRNLIYLLVNADKNKTYEAFSSDLRVWIPEYKRGVYPDVMVISEDPIFNENRQDEIINPCLIFEVLSPSTSSYDRGDKFLYYRSIPYLTEYILIDQANYFIEHYTKTDNNQWLLQDYQDIKDMIKLNSINIDVKISDIYENISITKE
ncbi:Uma2 family endonuclease [Cyanothece sp. BG0011]|uniref:Uma2 family endonuclease n=1 Tax=Cyanothece sp. BG0011 TaxID=2082950 RepID=UPI000D1FB500|nr:Uma2 family endonuclease [Cyanothece sp. BG0011]